MTFTELMALDKKTPPPKPAVAQSKTTSTTKKKRERPERGERPVRPHRPERDVRATFTYDIPEQPHKRERLRHSFDFYKDQIDSLRELRIKVMKSGRDASMSAMVREALDNYIKKQS